MADEPKADGTGTPPPAKPEEKAADPATTKPAEKPAAEGAAGDGAKKDPPAEPERKDGAAQPQPKAPEKYDLQVPKGAEVFFEPADLDAYAKLAKANELTQEEAQTMVEQEAQARSEMLGTFEAQTKADPTYGGDKLSETQQLARRAIERVRPAGHARTEAFNKLLTKTGYGNHIEVVSFLADLGRLMSEDRPGSNQSSFGSPQKNAADVLYGKQGS